MSNIGKQGIKLKKQVFMSDQTSGDPQTKTPGLSIKIISYKSDLNPENTNKNEIENKDELSQKIAESLGARPSVIRKVSQWTEGGSGQAYLNRILLVYGKKKKTLYYPSYYKLKLEEINSQEYELRINLAEEYAVDKIWRQYWGSFRANLANAIKGLVEGFTYTLKIKGVGYRASLNGEKLTLTLGFSHPIEVLIPEYIQVEIIGNAGTEIKITGDNKEKTSQWVHQVRLIKPSSKDHYKGAGLYLD